MMAPALGDKPVNVGTGALLMVTVTEFEFDGFALGVLTVTVAVPTDVRSDAGTLAPSVVLLKAVVDKAAPFHCTTEVELKPVPKTVMDVLGELTRMLEGETEVMAGLAGG